MGKSLAQLNVIIGAKVKGFEDALNGIQKKLRKFERSIESTGQSLTQNLTLPVAALGGASIKMAADMETMEASLVTAFQGSEVAAKSALSQITAFAANTPFQLAEVTQGFVKLKNMGLDPSIDSLTSYGNTASSMGKSLNDMVEAVADAAVGEFERLKEFGIKAKTQGDQVAFTFRGVTTTVQKNSEDIQKYLLDIGNTDFAGGIERQAGTVNGLFSTLRDNVGLALAELGKEIIQTFDLKQVVKDLTENISNAITWFKSLDDQVKKNIIRKVALAAAIGPVLIGIAKMISLIGGAIGTFTKLVTFALSPVTLAVVGLGAAALYVWDNWKAFSSRFTNMWTKITNFLSPTISFINGLIDSIVYRAVTLAMGFKEMYSPIAKFWKRLKNIIATVIKDITRRITQFAKFLKLDKIFDTAISIAVDTDPVKADELIDEPSFKSIGDTIDSLKGKVMDLLKLPQVSLPVAASTDTSSPIDLGSSSTTPTTVSVKTTADTTATDEAAEQTQRSLSTLGKIATGLESSIDSSSQSFIDKVAIMGEGMAHIVEKAKEGLIDITGLVEQSLESSVGAIGEGLGQMLTGAAGAKDVANAVLLPIIGMVDQLGDIAIQTGIALKAIKISFKSLGGVGAIAAGLALKALASAVKSKISNSVPALAEGGLAFGPTLALVGDNRGAGADPEVIAPLSKLSGMLQDVMKPMMVGYGPQPTAYGSGLAVEFGEIRLKGPDMYAAWKIQQKREGRIK